jgi:branched-chain amino acid transport system ATP-binding protein
VSPEKIVASGCSLVPEGRQVFSTMTVEENLILGGYVLAKSGGEQQMLAMGRALMAKPSLIMMDEPSTGLAPLIVKSIFQVILRLREEGSTVLLVEQNAKAALGIADRGYVLETGKISCRTGMCRGPIWVAKQIKRKVTKVKSA